MKKIFIIIIIFILIAFVAFDSLRNKTSKEALLQEVFIDNYRIKIEDFVYLDRYLMYYFTIQNINGGEIHTDTIWEDFPAYVVPDIHNKGLSYTKISRYDFEKVNKDKILVFGSAFFWNKVPPDRMYLNFEIQRGFTKKHTPDMSLDQQKRSEFYKHVDVNKEIHIDEKFICFDSIIFTPYNALAIIEISDQEWFNNSSYEIVAANGEKLIEPDVIDSYLEELNVGKVMVSIDKNDFKDSRIFKLGVIDKLDMEHKTIFEIDIEIPKLNIN